ncbi:hypothetical protein P9477_22255 [Enterobacter mori]|uniref:hypothetical protein n=1 Tax=Enterobacter mori TaxID=539813 RepID=UPI00398AC744
MNGVSFLSEYQDAVKAALMKIPWARTVCLYPEIPEGFSTPAVFFDVAAWRRAEAELGGNVTLELSCNFYVLRHFTVSDADESEEERSVSADTRVRNAALKISDWVHGRQFGPGTAPAEFISAEPVIWQKGEGGEDHAVWSVNFTQRLAVGADPFDEPDAPRLKAFWLGIFPDVGAGHEQDYTLIAKEE